MAAAQARVCVMDAQLITDVFRRFDTNRDGIISKEELMRVFSKLMPEHHHMEKLIAQMDTNGDGSVQYEEFVAWILKAKSGDGFDSDRAGILSAHAEGTQQKVQKVRASLTGAKRSAVFVEQLDSEKGRASLASMSKEPPKGALAICCALHNLLKIRSAKIDWPVAQKMLADPEALISSMRAFDPHQVPDYVIQSFEQALKLPYFQFERMAEQNFASACLGSWVVASAEAVRDLRLLAPVEAAAMRASAACRELEP